MDRWLQSVGAIPQVEDILEPQRFVQDALGRLIASTLGTSTLIDGFTCIPISPAGLAVQVTPGAIFELENVDNSTFGTLPADTSDQIMKCGVLLATQTEAITPPSTGGYSINYLIEIAFIESDGSPTVRPYYNSTPPNTPLSGPGGSGTPENTERTQRAIVTVKAGTVAATGTQVTPSADAGYVPAFVITVANGATSITSGNISVHPSAPFIPVKLPGVPAAVQNGTWDYAADSSASANTVIAAGSPTPAALVAGLKASVKIANANNGAATFNYGALGPKSIVSHGAALAGGELAVGGIADLQYDGTNWQLKGGAANSVQFPSGTTMLFFQASAPPGWTQVTTSALNDSLLRIVTGTGGGSYTAGQAFSTAAAAGTVNGHSITQAELPNCNFTVTDPQHHHTYPQYYGIGSGSGAVDVGAGIPYNIVNTSDAATGITVSSGGSGTAHTHGFTGAAFNINYINAIVCSKN